ncbi:autotransporter domain-containing protein [Pseudomonas costantinii]|nr:autotransporter domain-containing protein [Pseudomonas costantinii]NVZ20773.1 autotransporter domain-containing protein [Pseudomonas costantinii]
MHNRPAHRTPGRRALLAVAIASALTAGQSGIAQATVRDVIVPSGITVSSGTVGIFNPSGDSIGTLSNSGTISGNRGIYNNGSITELDNNLGGTISGSSFGILNNFGSIGTLNNSGTISGDRGIYNNRSTSIGTLANSGTISGVRVGISNLGSIGTLANTGTISGDQSTGIYNIGSGSIGTLSNSGSISSHRGIDNTGSITELDNNLSGTISGSSFGIVNSAGSIGTLNNSGTISGITAGIANNASIGTLNNRGTISGITAGISNDASIGTLNNSGTITSSGTEGIHNGGSIGSLTNSGTVTGNAGIYNTGSIDSLTNSGTITGQYAAIYNDKLGTLGPITNSGVIAGAIMNEASQDLNINGGTGSTFGLLTGFGGGTDTGNVGLITNTASNVIFGSGNQLLNDNINVGSFKVSNQGTLLVNNSITITGNYDQAANAKLLIGVSDSAVAAGTASDSGYGRLVVTGDANIASGSSVGLVSTHTYGFAQGQRYLVVQAGGAGTNYNADTLHYSVAGYDVSGASVVDGANKNLVLTVGAVQSVTPPVTPPTSSGPINRANTADGTASLAGLFNYQGFNADLMNVFNAAAANGSTAAGNKAGAQLSPTANLAAATQGSVASTVQVLNVTSAHLEGLRGGSTGVSTGEGPPTSGLWTQAFGGTAHMDERDDIAGYSARYNGLLLGADGMLNDNWRLGGLFSYTKTTLNNNGNNDGSSADVKSYGLFGYASYNANPWYLDLSVGAVQHQYDTQRQVDFTGVNGTAKGSHNGMQYTASAQAGYPIDLGASMANVILTPIAGLSYSTLRQDSYTEKGGAGTALHVNADNLNSLKSDLGAKLARAFATSYGSLTPSAQLTWRHEYRDSALQSVANFSADTTGATSFSSTGPKAVEDTGVLSVGLTLVTHNNLTVAAHYTGETGGGFNANTGDLQVRWAF